MLSGRRSHVSLKSKEAWFYEHLPVLILATNFLTKKLATEHEFCFRRIITDVTVLAFSLNCICLVYIDWIFIFQYVLTDIPACISEKKTYVWQLRFVTVKKWSYTFQLITQSRTYELIIWSVRKYIPWILVQASLPLAIYKKSVESIHDQNS